MSEIGFQKLAPGAARSKLASDIAFAGDFGFVAGVAPVDLADDKAPVPDGLERQVAKVFENLDMLLAAAGLGKKDIVSVRASLVHFERFIERFDTVYARYFSADNQPVRSCAGVVALTRGVLVEMDVVVYRPRAKT